MSIYQSNGHTLHQTLMKSGFMLERLPDRPILIIDAFNRMENDESLTLMADTLKALTDHAIETKVVIVGVADSIDALLGEHESVTRPLAEIPIPRMTESDQRTIIESGLTAVDMVIEAQAQRTVVRFAEGLPHYVHLLMLSASRRAVIDDRTVVTRADVRFAIGEACENHSLLPEYQATIQSPRRDNLFSRVLAACALAEKSRLGDFSASAVRDPMSAMMGKPYDIPAFAPHLRAFTEIDRGSVLPREGPERRYTYRFRNPLLQPFAVMTALAEGLLPAEMADELLGPVD